MNNKEHWIIFLILNNTLLLDNTLSNILFGEPINISDQTVLKQQEDIPKEKMKGT